MNQLHRPARLVCAPPAPAGAASPAHASNEQARSLPAGEQLRGVAAR